MLYLIKSGSNLKIGFTSDLDSRLSQYKVHNPDIRLLNYKSGTREDEKRLHTLCKEYKYSDEWFNKDKRILEIFQEYKNSDTVALNKKIKSLEQRVNELTRSVGMLNDRYENLTTTINKTTNNESDLITLCKRIVEWEERTLSRLDILENIISKII